MYIWKRAALLLLTALLLTGLLAACASPVESSELVGTQTILVEEPDKTDPSNEPAEPSEPETPEEPEAPEEPTEEVTAPTATGETDFSILFLDVGQADSMLITCGDAHMLVDGGNVADSSLVASVLQARDIDYLDYVVCTHAHEDHVGGLPGALHVAQAGTILAPVTAADNKPFTDFAEAAAAQGVAITVPEPDTTYALGDAAVQVLGPRQDYDDPNDTSLVLMVTYGETRFLLTGDMESGAEKDLLEAGCDLQADLLKVGHHGSSTSTSYVFLNAVMPQYAVIQVGKDNDYGHPSDDVLSRLRDADAAVYRTDLQGDILAVSDGETITVTTARNESIQTNPTEQTDEDADYAYIGNTNSKKFHRPTCQSLPAEQNRIYFPDRATAVAEGYDPCGNCNP